MAEGFFWGNDPNVNQQLRQRIAMSMMSQRKGFPKTLGEGLSAVGDAIGDIGMARMLERSDLAAQGVNPPPAVAPQQTGDAESVVKPEVLAYANPSDNTAEPAAQPATAPPPTEVERGVAGSGYNALDAVANTDPWMARSKAIAGIESGGEKDPYRTLGTTNTHSGDRAYGKYQIMGKNIPSWTQAATGQALTPQQFLASPAAQEATFRHRFGQYADKYGDEGAARAWYAGEHGMNKLDATDLHERLSVRDYGRDFMSRMAPYNRDRVTATITPQAGQPSAALPLTASDATSADLPSEITQGFSARAPQQLIQQAPPLQQPIRQAPPLQVAQAGQQPQATPGYVPPEAPAPSGAPIAGMTQREIQLRQWLAANQGNPYAAAKVAPELGALEQARTVRQNEANELFKARVLQQTEQNKIRQQALVDQAKRIADVARTEQETQIGRVIDPSDKQYTLGPDNVARPLKVEGGGSLNPTLTDVQTKNLDYYQRGRRALADLGSGDELQSFIKWHASGMPIIGNATVNAKFQEQLNAAKEFAAIELRKESGQAVTPKELDDILHRYIPRPGDKPDLMTQKEYMRNGVIGALRDTLGKGAVLADKFDQNFPAERARLAADKQQNIINAEMDGVPKVKGVIKTNNKTGVKRLWDGTRWTEVP